MATELDLSHAGSKIAADLGERVTIRLPEIAGTGYEWHVTPNAAVAEGVLNVSSAVHYDPAAAPGRALQRTFEVVPAARLHTTLVLLRYPPWGSTADADATFSVEINA